MKKYTAVGQTPILPSTQFRKQTPTPEPHGGPAHPRKHSLKLRVSHSWAFLSGFTTQVTQTAHCFLLPGFALYKIETTLCVCSEFSLDPQTSVCVYLLHCPCTFGSFPVFLTFTYTVNITMSLWAHACTEASLMYVNE